MAEQDDLTTRLRATSTRHTLSDATTRRHLDTIESELERPSPVDDRSARTYPGRRLITAAAAVLLVIAAGGAVASMSAIPGDRLYGTKQAIERVVETFDHDISAANRIDELARLIARKAERPTVRLAQDDATAALADLEADHRLHADYERLVLGARKGSRLQIDYLVETAVDWDGGETFEASMPNGDILSITRHDGAFSLFVTGDWFVIPVSGEESLVSDRAADAQDGSATVFRVEVTDAGVTVSLDSSLQASADSSDAGTDGETSLRHADENSAADLQSGIARQAAAHIQGFDDLIDNEPSDPAPTPTETDPSDPVSAGEPATGTNDDPGGTTTEAPAPATTDTNPPPTTTTAAPGTSAPPTTRTTPAPPATTEPTTTTTTPPPVGGDDDDDGGDDDDD